MRPARAQAPRNVFSCMWGEQAATTTRLRPSSLMSVSMSSWPVLEHMNLLSRAMTTPCPPSLSAAQSRTASTSTVPAMFVPQWQT